MEWINVEDMLPKQGGLYLGAINDEEVDLFFYFEKNEWQYYHGLETTQVTHWMPLPEPPKE